MSTRVCTTCGAEKPLDEFYVRQRDRRTKKPLTWRHQCKRCLKAANNKWAENRRNNGRPVKREPNTSLPIEPFRDWLRAQRERFASSVECADALGVSERQLSRWLREGDHVHIDSVDEVLLTEGSLMLVDLYPELYRFPDAPHCADIDPALDQRMLELRRRGLAYTAIVVVLDVYHGAWLSEDQVRRRLRQMGVQPVRGPHAVVREAA